ncbi:3beta-hydroxysteroid-dehydrogenase/decarboxylase isoform 2 [Sarracenia purpurea var. burkii]
MGGEERWCVVTGGRGFAARHLVEMLVRYDMFLVRIADLGPSINLDPDEEKGTLGEALRSGRAQYVSADLRDKSQVLKAFQGAEVVFHMAALDSSINNHELHHSVNVKGTRNVIDACIDLKVKRLVYTSSPSVVFDGVHGIVNGDEALPYPTKHNDSYSSTKAEGEVLVIKSNGINGLLTCCIRPSSIFGPGDKLLVPSLVSAARAGKLKFLIGDGKNMYDFTYVENVAHAHICAERALASEGEVAERAAGEEGLRKTIESYSHLRAECQYRKDGPSKSYVYLGRGRVADILLWRDKKQTLTTIFILIAIYFNFIASGYTIITAVSKLLLVASIFLFIHGILPGKVLGYTIEKIPGSSYYFSEEMSRQFALSVVSSWNSAVNSLESLCKGNDWTLFLKVVLSLLTLSFLGAFSLENLFVIGLPFAFVAFFVYEKKEEEIDRSVLKLFSFGCKFKSNIFGKSFESKKIQ